MQGDLPIHVKFDLKGSKAGRTVNTQKQFHPNSMLSKAGEEAKQLFLQQHHVKSELKDMDWEVFIKYCHGSLIISAGII